MTAKPRQIEDRDLDWVLALNQEHVAELSPLSPGRLQELLVAAFYARAIDDRAAFLLAFDQDADYDSPNFLWFRERFACFAYVDRIAVSGDQRGRGLARRLYSDLIQAARAAAQPRIVCEVNSDPPNPASDAFHTAFGFREAGCAELPERGKSVRYLTLDLS